MKCPKCGYLGFDSVDRCRNCGYDFSLSPSSTKPLDLELPLNARDAAPTPPMEDMLFGRDALPFFDDRAPDDLPLIIKPSPPRTPLAVRRATPEVPRMRVTPSRAPTLDLSGDALAPGPIRESAPFAGPQAEQRARQAAADAAIDAGIPSRVLALVLDLAILAAVDAGVVYFMLQICGIGMADLAIVPRVPLLAFFLVQNGGYFLAFTAGGGQTLGKMVVGIKVVSADPRSPFDLGRAIVREFVWLLLALPAGLGLLTALSGEHRGIHDRCAGTRVVRVPS